MPLHTPSLHPPCTLPRCQRPAVAVLLAILVAAPVPPVECRHHSTPTPQGRHYSERADAEQQPDAGTDGPKEIAAHVLNTLFSEVPRSPLVVSAVGSSP